jgi:glycosyltransferase involved in cell wall biosynthesis
MKKISFVSPTFNEVQNVDELYRRVTEIWELYPQYQYEYVVIDNASTDGTIEKLKSIAKKDTRVKIIVNIRNFGHIRSPYWGLLQASGDAVVYLASDLQDPPELIPQFIKEWEKGFKVILAIKPVSEGNRAIHFFRKSYYRLLNKISDVELINDTTGFGLYDKRVMDEVRQIRDPYPYLRGLICELGFPIKQITFNQPRRLRGVSKNNFYTLFDIAILGIVSHSLVPIRFASFLGIFIGGISLFFGFLFLVAKLIWWDSFPIGIAPILISALSLFGLLFIFIGILGEYIGSIQSYLQNRPIVVEQERINFETSSESSHMK